MVQNIVFMNVTDKTFNFNAVRQVYKKFCKFDFSSYSKASINIIIWQVAIVTDAVDSCVKRVSENCKTSPPLFTNGTYLTSICELCTNNEGESSKEGPLPQKPGQIIQYLLSIAALYLLQCYLYTVLHSL